MRTLTLRNRNRQPLGKLAAFLVYALAVFVGIGVPAFAYWSTIGSGTGSASTATLNAPTQRLCDHWHQRRQRQRQLDGLDRVAGSGGLPRPQDRHVRRQFDVRVWQLRDHLRD